MMLTKKVERLLARAGTGMTAKQIARRLRGPISSGSVAMACRRLEAYGRVHRRQRTFRRELCVWIAGEAP